MIRAASAELTKGSRLAIEVGGLAIGLESTDPRWSAVLEPRYGPFRTGRTPEIVVELASRGVPRDVTELGRLRTETPALVGVGEPIRLRSASLEASVWPRLGRARLSTPLDRHGVDVLLPLLLALRLDDALLVHSTLAIENHRAFLCAGPSGAGKSTLAELLGERCYCDELALLRRGTDGWRALSLPYWQGRPGEGRLAGVRMLRHGVRHRLDPIGPREALRRLAGQLIWPAHSETSCQRTLALLELLLAEVPVAELAFRPTADVWPVLSGEAAA